MPVQFRCRECESVLKAPDAARGKVMTCKTCGAKNKVPAGGAKKKKPKAKRPPKRTRDSGEFLAGDLSGGEDSRFTVCQNCGEQYQGDDPVCPYCGYDNEARRLTEDARREQMKKKGKVVKEEYYDVAKGDAMTYLFNQVPFALKSGLFVMIPGVISIACAFLVVYNGKTPPKFFFGFVSLVFAMGAIGWPLTLIQIVVRSTLAKQEKLKRVTYDFFQAAADGVTFLSLQCVYIFPAILAIVGAYFYGQDNPGLGIALMLLGPVLMTPLYPLILSHLAMPVNWPAWVFTKAFALFGKVSAASFYWLGFTAIALLPGLIGLGVAGGVFGEDIVKTMEDVHFNADLSYQKYLAERGDIEKAPEGEAREVDYEALIAPGVIITLSLFYLGFVVLYPARICGLMAMYFKRDLGLIEEKAEKKYVSKERRLDDDGNVIVERSGPPVLLIRLGGTVMFYVVANVVCYFATGGKYVILPRPLALALRLVAE